MADNNKTPDQNRNNQIPAEQTPAKDNAPKQTSPEPRKPLSQQTLLILLVLVLAAAALLTWRLASRTGSQENELARTMTELSESQEAWNATNKAKLAIQDEIDDATDALNAAKTDRDNAIASTERFRTQLEEETANTVLYTTQKAALAAEVASLTDLVTTEEETLQQYDEALKKFMTLTASMTDL